MPRLRHAWLVALLAASPASTSEAQAPAARVSVAIVGDSIVEASHPGLPSGDGLVPRVRDEIARRGFDPGTAGFVAAHPAEIAPVLVPAPTAAHGAWTYSGAWAWLTRTPGLAAPIVSWTANPSASATLSARSADHATLVYLEGPTAGSFIFRAGQASTEVHATRVRQGVGMRTLALGSSSDRRVEVTRPLEGSVGLVGALLRRRPRPGGTQVELIAVAHGGAQASDVPTPAEDAGLSALQPSVTVIILGTNDGIGYARSRDRRALVALRAGLARRGRRARTTGACLMVAPARAHFPAAVFSELRHAVDVAARRAGCATAPILDLLDRDPALTVDGVHPTSAGYRRLAAALAPRILQLAGATSPATRG